MDMVAIERKCENCKWSEPYFRGLLCNWAMENNIVLPSFLAKQLYIEGIYPYQLNETNFALTCRVYKEK